MGRNGLHRYKIQDHAKLTGIQAVRNLILGQHHDLWFVNAEVLMNIPIFSYHVIQDDDGVLSISADVFAWQMAWLAENKYQVIPLSKIGEVLDSGN